MDSFQLQRLAERSRMMREAGIGILIASLILGVFVFIPLGKAPVAEPVVATTPEPTPPDAYAAVPLEAKAAIVYDLATKQVLYAKNADAQLPLASLTKLLTVYTATQTLSLDTPVTVPAEATRLDYPRAFNEGQTFSLSDLARLTLTASLNDGAAAIIEAAANREGHSASEALAGAAAALDLAQTYALNGSGLDINTAVSGGYGSARDLAILAGALVNAAPRIAEATTRATVAATSQGGTRIEVKNTDPMVDTIPHILLSKTGFTDLAGGNLALVFDVGINHPVAVVLLGSSKTARFTDGTALVNATLAHFAGVDSL